ncbi:MAG: gephyrin-like molybdotransferase Glp [Rhodothalassiaceae bacterium]
MLSVAEARQRILDAMSPTPAEEVMLTAAAGRVLAAPVVARRTQPPADMSAMDGYAVRAADVRTVPVALKVVGAAPAGGVHEGAIRPGEAVRIFTGAPVPDGADTIVIQEDTERVAADRVRILAAPAAGRHIRRAGIDFCAGDTVLEAGTRLAARHLMLAAAADAPWLRVHRRPRIALLATGDELVRPGSGSDANSIVQSITPALAAFIAARGGDALDLGIARDQRESLHEHIAGAAGADLLLTVGGASVGDYDIVRNGLGEIGLEIDFWKVAQRPGKPLLFGRLGTMPMLGLPGNPVSAMLCAILYLGPAVDRLAGGQPRLPVKIRGRCAEPLAANGPREAFLRAKIRGEGDGMPLLSLQGLQDSSLQAALARADALIHRPAHAPAAAAGDVLEAYLLDPQPGA